MDPQLEFFLEDAFKSIQPTSPQIGRVVVEPDYDVSPVPQDRGELSHQLTRFLQEQSPDLAAVASPRGYEIRIPRKYRVLAKYLRQITLHGERVSGPWVEVAPPGNWI